jgi:hypothetical protein
MRRRRGDIAWLATAVLLLTMALVLWAHARGW